MVGAQIIAVRYTIPEDYGLYAFTFAVYVVLETLITSSLSDVSTHRISAAIVKGNETKAKEQFVEQFVLEARTLWISGAIFCCFATLFLCFGQHSFNAGYFMLLSLSLPFSVGYSSAKSILIASNKIQLQAKFEIFSSALIILTALICTLNFGIWGVVMANPLYTLLKTASAYFVINKYTNFSYNFHLVKAVFTKNQLNTSLRFTSQSLVRNGLYNLANQLDMILVGIYQTPANVAFYKVAKTLASIPSRAILPIWSALRGRIVEAFHRQDHQRLARLILTPIGWMLLLSAGMGVVSYFLLPHLIRLFYTAQYLPAFLPALIIMLGYSMFQITMGWFNIWVVISGKPYYSSLISLLIISVMVIFSALYGHISTVHFALVYSISLGLAFFAALILFISKSTRA